MILTYWRGEASNFGDELNAWLWPKFLPDFFDDDPGTVFLGIGSIIGFNRYRESAVKVVFGSGYVPEYHGKVDMALPRWDVFFVRGALSAKLLNLPAGYGIGDPASLVRLLHEKPARSGGVVSFMPHWQSMTRGRWDQVCRLAGLNLIDPRRPVQEILGELDRSRLLITEAMHGAIVADTLRIPWIPVLPIMHMHRMKWHDWSATLGLELPRHRLLPSSLTEVRLGFMRRPLSQPAVSRVIHAAMLDAAAHRLVALASKSPLLSDERKLDASIEGMMRKVAELRKKYSASSAMAESLGGGSSGSAA